MLSLGIVAAFVIALVICLLLWRVPAFQRVLDQPNHRSMHSVPTPSSGGLGIVVGVIVALLLMGTELPALIWLPPLVLIAAVSLLDDIRHLPPALRILGQLGAVLWLFGALRDLDFVILELPVPAWAYWSVGVLGALWLINLYNFMDGMDGFAGSMALTGFSALGLLGWWQGDLVYVGLNGLIAAASLGFLVFNWPPAKIFMGDVGAVSLGLLAVFSGLLGVGEGLVSFWQFLLIFLPFWLDATVTLVKRIARRERIWEAHKSHYYQRQVHQGLDKRKVLGLEIGLMLICAGLALGLWRQAEVVQLGALALMVVITLTFWWVLDHRQRQALAAKGTV